MKKSDTSLKRLTIASIKRHTMKPFIFNFSKFYENGKSISNDKINSIVELENEEELICSTIINDDMWSILTSRRLITFEHEEKSEHSLLGVVKRNIGNFKGYFKQEYTKSFIQFDDGVVLPFFIETGKASMIMINGVDTLVQLLK